MHVVIADDHRLVTDTFAEYLKKYDPDTVIEQMETLDEVVEWSKHCGTVDLILLDIKMPGVNGFDGLVRVRECFPDIPVVIISGFGNQEMVAMALKLGAVGFIPKEMSGPAVIKALELVVAGEIFVPSRFMPEVWLGDGPRRRHSKASWGAGNSLNQLSPRETEVLTLLAKGHSNKQISDALQISGATAAFHVAGLRQKLGASNRTQVVTKALKLGWAES